MPTFYTDLRPGQHFGQEIFNPVFDALEVGIKYYKGWQALTAWTVMGGTTASVTFSSISSIYRHLRLMMWLRGTTGANAVHLQIILNGDTAKHHYNQFEWGNSINSVFAGNDATYYSAGRIVGSLATAGYYSPVLVDFVNYSATVKTIYSRTYQQYTDNDAGMWVTRTAGLYTGSAAISSILVQPLGGSFAVDSAYALYGMDR